MCQMYFETPLYYSPLRAFWKSFFCLVLFNFALLKAALKTQIRLSLSKSGTVLDTVCKGAEDVK